ncbi:MAG: hypothetical protein IPM13_10325 [Phycisphaerales bacterium]|nr:hypothetical protein [Phycisphaerales bacterium]
MATLITLAEAIIARLQAGTFSLPFEVQRGYRPALELPDLAAVRVTVIPKSLAVSQAARSGNFYDCTIDIGVQRKVSPDIPAELDALMGLVEEIGDHLRGQSLPGMPEAAWLWLENEPVFAPEHLEQQHLFTSVLSLTYRVRR